MSTNEIIAMIDLYFDGELEKGKEPIMFTMLSQDLEGREYFKKLNALSRKKVPMPINLAYTPKRISGASTPNVIHPDRKRIQKPKERPPKTINASPTKASPMMKSTRVPLLNFCRDLVSTGVPSGSLFSFPVVVSIRPPGDFIISKISVADFAAMASMI